MKLLYWSQIDDRGLSQIYEIPLIRYRRGLVTFGARSIIRGKLTVVFDGLVFGKLTMGEAFVADGDCVISPRGGAIEIGDRCFIGRGCVLQSYEGSQIRIGNDVMIAHGVSIVASNHRMDPGLPMMQQPEKGSGIVLADDIWIGANAVILDGSMLGMGCVVAAGAVVRGKIEPYTIVAGIPAKKIGVRSVSS